jgi:hypothetical protein
MRCIYSGSIPCINLLGIRSPIHRKETVLTNLAITARVRLVVVSLR